MLVRVFGIAVPVDDDIFRVKANHDVPELLTCRSHQIPLRRPAAQVSQPAEGGKERISK
jgi:hypothetical protein